MGRSFLISVLCLFFVLGCTSQSKNDNKVSQSSGSWPDGMRRMAQSLNKLMPIVYSQKEFTDSANRKKIGQLMAEFEKSVDMVPQHTGEVMLGKDPMVKFALSRLKANTDHARQAFLDGHTDYSRNVLRDNLGLCFSCHTATQFGPENTDTAILLKNNFRIAPNERANYYVATRQFDKAVSVLDSIIETPAQAIENPHEQVEALRMYLSIQVRVKKNPGQSASLIERFLSMRNLPYFIAVDAEAWQKSLQEWVREKNSKGNSLLVGQRLLAKAKTKQGADGYQSGYVDYLRASANLHEALRESSEAKTQALIYFLLGQSYESLSESGVWELPEIYYEACIRRLPKSDQSKSCYRAFEKTVMLGFSGSSGVFIPKSERERMKELETLAGLARN